MSQFLFDDAVEFSEDAITHLQQDGVAAALASLKQVLSSLETFSAEAAQTSIKQVVKEQGVKKGLVMKSLRASLTGSLKGPDLMESWLLLHQRGVDLKRIEQAIAQA